MSATPTPTSSPQALGYIQDELDTAALYDALAEGESDANIPNSSLL